MAHAQTSLPRSRHEILPWPWDTQDKLRILRAGDWSRQHPGSTGVTVDGNHGTKSAVWDGVPIYRIELRPDAK
jgi:hypothetical protein